MGATEGILVDSSIWVDHLRRGNSALALWLERGEVLGHRFVLGELACGRLPQRAACLQWLQSLPQALHATHEETMRLLESRQLHGRSLGYVDLHLLAACLLSHATLATRDEPLRRCAQDLAIEVRSAD